MKLHGYFRSTASYRVRIALNLKGLRAEHLARHLRKGEQCAPAYLAINPQGLVPALENDAGAVLTQSLAIIEWLDETYPEPPLLPKDPLRRAKVRAFAMAGLRHPPGAKSESAGAAARARRSRRQGDGMGRMGQPRRPWRLRKADRRRARPFCFGDTPTIADLCLVPQLANARRFGVDVYAFPRLLKAEAAAKAMPAFADAAPDKQPDAE